MNRSFGCFFLIVNQHSPVSLFNLMPAILNAWDTGVGVRHTRLGIMPSRVEEYLQKAIECEESACAAEKHGIATNFRKVAEYWRTLAKIVGNRSEGPTAN
jgi:hypothetical protein